jgi:hypothetical protein
MRFKIPREAGTRKKNGLQQVAPFTDTADSGKIRTDLSSGPVDPMADGIERGLRFEYELSFDRIAGVDPGGMASRRLARSWSAASRGSNHAAADFTSGG